MYPYPRSQSTENKWKCWVFTTTLHHEEGDFSRAIMNHDRRFRFFIWNLAPLKYGVVDYLVTTEQYSAQPLQSAPIWMWDRERAQWGAAIFITSPLAWSGLGSLGHLCSASMGPIHHSCSFCQLLGEKMSQSCTIPWKAQEKILWVEPEQPIIIFSIQGLSLVTIFSEPAWAPLLFRRLSVY